METMDAVFAALDNGTLETEDQITLVNALLGQLYTEGVALSMFDATPSSPARIAYEIDAESLITR